MRLQKLKTVSLTVAFILGAVMMVHAEESPRGNEFIDADPVRYANGVLVPARAGTLYIGGQVGLDENGDMPADFESQLRLVFKNTKLVLEEAGMSPDDIVEMTYYVVAGEGRMGQDYWIKVFEIRNEVLGELSATGALVYVPALYRPEALVEISSIAAK